MRITVALCGHYDWVPVPDDVKVTEEDKTALRVKETLDGKYLMRVDVPRDTHFTYGPHEQSIVRQIVAKAKAGDDVSRKEIVATELAATIKHHFARKHAVEIEVEDDGPQRALMEDALAEFQVTGDHAAEILNEYLASDDVADHLKSQFIKRGAKKARE